MGSLSRKIQKSQNESKVRRIKTAHEAYQEGMLAGYKKGHREGFASGGEAVQDIIDEALFILFGKIATLDQVNDIGPKRFQKILDHFDIPNKENLENLLRERTNGLKDISTRHSDQNIES